MGPSDQANEDAPRDHSVSMECESPVLLGRMGLRLDKQALLHARHALLVVTMLSEVKHP
jgi:hypothetical protein